MAQPRTFNVFSRNVWIIAGGGVGGGVIGWALSSYYGVPNIDHGPFTALGMIIASVLTALLVFRRKRS